MKAAAAFVFMGLAISGCVSTDTGPVSSGRQATGGLVTSLAEKIDDLRKAEGANCAALGIKRGSLRHNFCVTRRVARETDALRAALRAHSDKVRNRQAVLVACGDRRYPWQQRCVDT